MAYSTGWTEASLRRPEAPNEWIVVRGSSMEPLLVDGDRILVTATHDRAPSVGEIVVYRQGPDLVAHRVVAARGQQLVTKGDAATRCDAPIGLASVLARVVETRRSGRRGLRWRLGWRLRGRSTR